MGKTENEVNQSHMLLLTTIALGTLLNPLNSSMIAVALSRLREAFQLDFADVSWLISTYYLASAIVQPVMGKLGDMWGHKRLFLLGLLLVAGASLLAPFSPGFIWLIGFRMIQAIGSSALFPSGMGMVRNVISSRQAGALGVLSIFSSTSAALGPSVGGFLIHFGDWPAIFLVNFPFIIVSFLLGLKVLPNDHKEIKQRSARSTAGKIDIAGMLFFSVAVVGLLIFLLSFETTPNWLMLGLSLLAGVIFYRYEKRPEQPFIDVRTFSENINMSLVYVQFTLVNIIFYSMFFGIPTFLQNVRHFDANTTGLMMLSIAGFGIISTPLAGRWIDRSGPKPGLLFSSSMMLAGSLLLLSVQDDSSKGWMFFVFSVLGICNGFNNLGLQTALYAFVPRSQTGAASGLFMTSRYMGTILSSSLLGNVFGQTITTGQLHEMAWICAGLGGLILFLSIRMPGTHFGMEKAAR